MIFVKHSISLSLLPCRPGTIITLWSSGCGPPYAQIGALCLKSCFGGHILTMHKHILLKQCMAGRISNDTTHTHTRCNYWYDSCHWTRCTLHTLHHMKFKGYPWRTSVPMEVWIIMVVSTRGIWEFVARSLQNTFIYSSLMYSWHCLHGHTIWYQKVAGSCRAWPHNDLLGQMIWSRW